MNLTTLEQIKERDLIVVYRLLSGMEEMDMKDLTTWDTRKSRGRRKRKPKEETLTRIAVHKEWWWHGKNVIHKFMAKLDYSKHRDGTVQV